MPSSGRVNQRDREADTQARLAFLVQIQKHQSEWDPEPVPVLSWPSVVRCAIRAEHNVLRRLARFQHFLLLCECHAANGLGPRKKAP